MKKIIVYLIPLLCFVFQLNAQNQIDTTIIYQNRFSSVREIKYKYLFLYIIGNKINLVEGKNNGSDKYSKNQCYSKFHDKNGMDVYFKFYLRKDNRLIEEGFWDFYSFNGNYKSYFKNGKLKSEGVYFQGVEIGEWIYYKKDGSIFRVINYPININRIEVREEQKIDIKTAINLYDYPTSQDSINFVKSVKGKWLRRYR